MDSAENRARSDLTGRELRWVAAGSLLSSYAFWHEYLPPVQRVHLPYDIHSYHYPLLQSAFEAVSRGRFPEWDQSIYCGLSFVGNIQATLFYPPTWLLFVANLGRQHLSYKSLELLVFLHMWLAFLLFYVWLRGRGVGILAGLLGSCIFAFSGYMMSQNTHLGVVTGYAWTPLGLWGIDQAVRSGSPRFLWKATAASAMCFLAGFPPTWVVLCVSLVVYAAAGPRGLRTALATLVALGASVLVVMVQLLPSWEAAALKTFDPKYGAGIRDLRFFVTYLLPNFYDFGRTPVGSGVPPAHYLYLGAPAFFGLACLVRARWRELWPLLAVGLVSLVGVTNPFDLVWTLLSRFRLLAEMCHSFNFLEGVSLSVAGLASVGIDTYFKRDAHQPSRWLAPLVTGLLLGWTARQLWVWWPEGTEFSSGWKATVEPAVMLALFSLGAYAARGERGSRRTLLAVAALVAVGVDYKVFGTSRRFNADPEDVDKWYESDEFIGMDTLAYRELRSHPDYRIAVGETGPFPTGLRHHGLLTPQGFDPFIPSQYKSFIEKEGRPFSTDRLFYISPNDERLLQLLGVRYFLVTENSAFHQTLLVSSDFRPLQTSGSFFPVFEYTAARPAYYWDTTGYQSGTASIQRGVWTAERREFRLRSERGGRFVLAEQFFPGWRCWVDGREAPIERWQGTFQAVVVPPGEHQVKFEFRSLGLRIGAWVTILSLLGIMFVARPRRNQWPLLKAAKRSWR